MSHPHYKTGLPCDCTFGPRDRLAKTAAKLDWLRERPDMQTHEAQQWLNHLEINHPHADPLFPWMTREMKRGRLLFNRGPQHNDIRVPGLGADPGGLLTPGTTRHWMDWYNSNHPTRQGVDIGSKAFQVPQMLERINSWDQAMRDEADQAKIQQQEDAPVLHQWPDGWKLQRLLPRHLDYEGENMGHCVGGYGYEGQVQNGSTAIVSLRDPNGRPHVTAELEPDLRKYDSGDQIPPYPPFDINDAIAAHPAVRHTPPYVQEALRQIHDEAGGLPRDERKTYTDTHYPPEAIEGDYGQIYEQLRAHHKQNSMMVPPLDNARVVQIQGRGNEVPKPEYQQRLKDWFQTFPEATRPNWEYPTDAIEHIGALVPDARTMEEGHHRRYNEVEGEPGLHDGEWAEGGYGPHGDYGLAPALRPIDYLETMKSLVRPQDYQDMEYGWHSYDPHEAKTLYQEALRRGEIPEMGTAFQPFAEHAMDQFSNAQDHEMMYNPEYPNYPGESWDEEPERWQGQIDYNGEAVDPQEAWQAERDRYDEAEEELANNHPWFRAENDLYKWLQPHLDAKGDQYHNAPAGQDYTDPATRAAQMNFTPNTGSPGAFVKDLAMGAQYMDKDGMHHTVTQTDPLRVDGRPPGWRENWESTVPPFIKPPPTPPAPQTFSKVAKRYGPHLRDGQICHCRFGTPGRLSHRRQASKLDWLRSRPDMQTEEGNKLLNTLYMWSQTRVAPNEATAFDKVLPWIVREIKRGRITFRQDHGAESGTLSYSGPNGFINPRDIVSIGQYLDEMKKQRQGIDLMQKAAPELLQDARTWATLEDEKLDPNAQDLGEIVHQWPDGWTMRRLQDGYEAELEGSQMGNCVGTGQYGYRDSIDSGDLNVYSLRSPSNKPHATIAVDPNGSIEELEDRSGKFGDKYKGRVMDWYDNAGDLSYDGWGKRRRYDDYYEMEGPQNIDELLGMKGDDDLGYGVERYPSERFYEMMPEEYREAESEIGYGPGMPELRIGDPNYHDILASLTWDKGGYRLGPGGYGQQTPQARPYNPEAGQYVLEHAAEAGHIPQLKEALEGHHADYGSPFELPDAVRNHPDPVERQRLMEEAARDHYYQTKGDSDTQLINHLLPQVDPTFEPYGPAARPINPNQQNLFRTPHPDSTLQDSYSYPQYENLPYDAWRNPQPITYSKTASQPLYHRFVFSPTSGEVDLSNNTEAEPKLHGELAKDRNEPGLVHGYAYRIGGGWRLTDWEHKPLDDRYVVAQVMRRLRREEGFKPAQDGSWEVASDDFDRQHHSMPAS